MNKMLCHVGLHVWGVDETGGYNPATGFFHWCCPSCGEKWLTYEDVRNMPWLKWLWQRFWRCSRGYHFDYDHGRICAVCHEIHAHGN